VVKMPTRYGEFRAIGMSRRSTARITSPGQGQRRRQSRDVLVRVHSDASRATSSARCAAIAGSSSRSPCGASEEGPGVVLYMRQESRQSACSTSSRPMLCRRRAATRSRQPRAWVPGRPARLWHRRPDPGRPGAVEHPHDDQQPQEADRPRGLRPHDRRSVLPIEVPPHEHSLTYLRTKRREDGPPAGARELLPAEVRRRLASDRAT